MGSESSRLRDQLVAGNETLALDMWNHNMIFQKMVDIHAPYGDSYSRNTPLHLAAHWAMKDLLHAFQKRSPLDLNVVNAKLMTPVHLACQQVGSRSEEDRRQCLVLLLNCLEDKDHISIPDLEGNTPLHYAAAAGLLSCAQILHTYAPGTVFARNLQQKTPCDLATEEGHEETATYLERCMVFSENFTVEQEEEADSPEVDGAEEEVLPRTAEGLSQQELQEAKDNLLVETSDMLHVQLFVSEALLRAHEWSPAKLLHSWMQDSASCCRKAGVEPPTVEGQAEYSNGSLSSPAHTLAPLPPDTLCEICICLIAQEDSGPPLAIPCHHHVCKSCWAQYLTLKIQGGEAHSILCPAFDCLHIVPVEVIDRAVSPEMVRRYLQFDIKDFVEGSPEIKWCPHPTGCSRAVRVKQGTSPSTVDCGAGHFFCWICRTPAHYPCSCDHWQEWQTRVASMDPELLSETLVRSNEAANSLWLVTHSKSCPCCKAPIQKNEGCNHMNCYKCKHDFCWVCLEPWKHHNTKKDGYNRCTLVEAAQRAAQQAAQQLTEANSKNHEIQEMKEFAVHYSAFKQHEDKYEKELLLLPVMEKKTEQFLDEHRIELDQAEVLRNAVKCLLHSRRVLSASHIYSIQLEDDPNKLSLYELMQRELTKSTEQLSGMLCRPYLQTPWAMLQAQNRQTLRHLSEFLKAVERGLLPPDTPPHLRGRHRFPHLPGLDPPPLEDDELRRAILASLRQDSEDSWVVDSRGLHTNPSAIFTRHTSLSDDEEDDSTFWQQGAMATRPPQNLWSSESQADLDTSMDLLIALEMSRLQLEEERQRQALLFSDLEDCNGASPTSSDSEHSPEGLFAEGPLRSLYLKEPDLQQHLNLVDSAGGSSAKPSKHFLCFQ